MFNLVSQDFENLPTHPAVRSVPPATLSLPVTQPCPRLSHPTHITSAARYYNPRRIGWTELHRDMDAASPFSSTYTKSFSHCLSAHTQGHCPFADGTFQLYHSHKARAIPFFSQFSHVGRSSADGAFFTAWVWDAVGPTIIRPPFYIGNHALAIDLCPSALARDAGLGVAARPRPCRICTGSSTAQIQL